MTARLLGRMGPLRPGVNAGARAAKLRERSRYAASLAFCLRVRGRAMLARGRAESRHTQGGPAGDAGPYRLRNRVTTFQILCFSRSISRR
jgi:hypothetical protein